MTEENKPECDAQKSKTKQFLAYYAISFFSVLSLILCFRGIPSDNKDMVNFVLGVICGVTTTVFGFYFGDSEKKRAYNESETK